MREDDLEPTADSQALHLADISLLVARLFLPGQEPGHTIGALFSFLVSHKNHTVLETGVPEALSPFLYCSVNSACMLSCVSKLL